MIRTDSIDGMIRQAGWYHGTRRQWQSLTSEQRADLAFSGCGCEVAYPTWPGPVDCVHTGCQIRRGEKPPITLTNRTLRSEIQSGWLRFAKDSTEGRRSLARLIRAIRRTAIETGIYDPWQMPGGWSAMVSVGVWS